MNRELSSSSGPAPQALWVYSVLGDQNFEKQRGFFAWWYRLTSPPNALPAATFQQRDRIRRCRLASALMLFLGVVLLIAGAIGISSPNHTIVMVVGSMTIAILISIPINRRGRVEVVGFLMILGLTIGMYTSIVANAFSMGMSANDKDILYLLFFSELFAGALLPVNVVLFIALINIVFSFVSLRFLPHDPTLTLMLRTSFQVIFPRLVQIHIIASGVMWILVNNLKAALQRADLAEEVAKLQHAIAEMASQQVLEKQALEHCIEEIVAVHTKVANGDLNARVPYTQGNTLWRLAGALNNLLGRFQHARQAEEEMLKFSQRIAEAQTQLRQEVTMAMQEQRPIQLPVKDPLLATFYQELNGKYLTPSRNGRLVPR
jgi:hypothetical protein